MRELNISLIGVPVDLGQSRRGVDMGPSAIRYAGAAVLRGLLRAPGRQSRPMAAGQSGRKTTAR